MKRKILLFIFSISFILPLITAPTFASMKVVDISRPESDEIVTKSTFSVCGVSIYEDAIVELSYKDKESGVYKPLNTKEGTSVFKVGKFFGKDIELRYMGKNEIRIKVYTKFTKNDPQIEDYTITLAEEKKKSAWWERQLRDTLKGGFSFKE